MRPLATTSTPNDAEAIQELAEKHRGDGGPELAGLRAKYTHAKGWHFALPQAKPATGRGAGRAAGGGAAQRQLPK
jgi:hypothetical protein